MAYLTLTLEDVRDAAREVAGHENTTFVTDATLNRHINKAIEKLVRATVQTGDPYELFGKSATLTGSAALLTAPTDFHSVYHLFEVGTPRCPYERLQPFERPHSTEDAGPHSLTLEYLPVLTRLSDDADEFAYLQGWDDYVIHDVAARILIKEESDVRSQLLLRDEALREMLADASRSSHNQAQRVQDVRYGYVGPGALAAARASLKRYRVETGGIRIFSLGRL